MAPSPLCTSTFDVGCSDSRNAGLFCWRFVVEEPKPCSAPGDEKSSMPGMFSEHMPGMEDFSSPGSEQGFGSSTTTRQQNNSALRESEQPTSNVEVQSGEGAMRLSYIRYLPMQNEAQVPVEKAVVQYQHAAEAVLTQEQIPRAYREQIKQYFLSLGMMK